VIGDDNPRIVELRRRVQADPASIAFGQLAEECRRAGGAEEAVAICRSGLAHHPDYLSARVTLGRALLELGRLDEAQGELNIVLTSAADNLAANRALAEVYQKRGQLHESLAQYKRALDLAKFDLDIEEEVRRLESVVAPPAPAPAPAAAPISVEELFDFDTLLAQLGGGAEPQPAPQPAPSIVPVSALIESSALKADDADPFSLLERQLRELEQQSPIVAPSEEELHERRVLAELETWLATIVADRENRLPA
jgi:tetratricopeptide (TPR) repeat protein